MEFFENAKVVRLRSYHDKYLLADEDEENVYQDRHGDYDNAKWNVEIVESYATNFIRLKSCYGKYLTATNIPFLLGSMGFKVLQTLPSSFDSSLEWEPIREGMQVRLKTCYGKFLRGNGGVPPWRNSITHDVSHRTASANWVFWDVEVMELRTPSQSLKPISMIERSYSFNSYHSPINSPLLSHYYNNKGSSCVRSADDHNIKYSRRPIGECKDPEENELPLQERRSIIFYDMADDYHENGDNAVPDANKEEKLFRFPISTS